MANYDRVEAIRAMEKLLASGIEFDAIYAHSDSMVTGAWMALAMANIDAKDLIIAGVDYIPEVREAIRSGKQDISFIYPTAGRQLEEAVVQIIRGQVPEKLQTVPFEW